MMEALFISPSKLEMYRKFIKGEYRDSITFEMLVDYIKGVTVWTPKSTFGTAYHFLIENGPEKYEDWSTGKYTVFSEEMPNPVHFTHEQVEPVIYFRKKYPKMVYECRHSHTFEVNGKAISMPMRIDGLNGIEVHEQKTVEGEFKLGPYQRSLQWKIYLWAMDANMVQYNIFEYESAPENPPYPLVKYRNFKLYSYHGMVDDIMEYLSGFLLFCETHGLIEYLTRDARPVVIF